LINWVLWIWHCKNKAKGTNDYNILAAINKCEREMMWKKLDLSTMDIPDLSILEILSS